MNMMTMAIGRQTPRKYFLFALIVFALVGCVRAQAEEGEQGRDVLLDTLQVRGAIQMWKAPRVNANNKSGGLSIDGHGFEHGVGTHAPSRIYIRLDGRAERFIGLVGVDDRGEDKAGVVFNVIGDGKRLWTSRVMYRGDKARRMSVDVGGVDYLTLQVTDAGDGIAGDLADWVDAGFRNVSGPIAVVERLPEQAGKIVSGAAWRDTDGEIIQAHGGGVLHHDGKYYWYGEDRSDGYVGIGVSGYVSEDLVNWRHLGVVLPKSAYDKKWGDQNINERPKVIYNPRTDKFVMWFHYDRSGYGDSQAGVAVADKPEGPFTFLGALRPVKDSTYRDMNLFVDDDGSAYAIYAGEGNATLHIVRLNDDWTAPQEPMVEGKTWTRALVKQWREAPAVFKHAGRYYLVSSACTGWAPNAADVAVADNMLGPWKTTGNPFVGAGSDLTFGTQSTCVLPVPGKPGVFIYMGDHWNPSMLADSRYVWLPFKVKRDGTFEVRWLDEWSPSKLGFPEPALAAAAQSHLADNDPADGSVEPTRFTDEALVYRLAEGESLWPVDKRDRIVRAMNEAVGLYNELGTFPKQVVASYNSSVPTADGNYNGNIRFGGQISERVALHELGHVLGVGQYRNWDSFIKDGKWTGEHALAQLREFDGPDAVLHADRMHFWPYGLNYDKEASPENFRRHVLMVAALRKDMGIVSRPLTGGVRLATYETQAEFRDIKITRDGKTLYQSSAGKGLDDWRTTGDWHADRGVLRQTGNQRLAAAALGKDDWADYTIELKARKIGGAEGFIINFAANDRDKPSRWNLGGWGNKRHGLEVADGTSSYVPGKIDTDRWYNIRIELNGPTVKAYLDNKLIQQARR